MQAFTHFNANRIEHWQRDLSPGDYFALVLESSVVLYGEVLEYDEDPEIRLVSVFSEVTPDGEDDLFAVYMIDLPMTKTQFDKAKELGWPSEMAVLRALVGMTKPAMA